MLENDLPKESCPGTPVEAVAQLFARNRSKAAATRKIG